MSGSYAGLQAKFDKPNKLALQVPCAGYSINLVDAQAVDWNLSITIYFDFVQNLYRFLFIVNTSLENTGFTFRSLP
jgi:hypothetical protein